jgi:hypothetical protein
MATEWVDFKKVKEAVDMQMVLDHYGIKRLTKSGDERRGPCPIHKGSPRSKNFTVNIRKNAFNCFSSNCKARGNVLDFVAAMENCDVRAAALKLAEWFKIGESEQSSPEHVEANGDVLEVSPGIYSDPNGGLFEVITTALSGEDLESLVVYRELFGDYRHWVASVQNFGSTDCKFTLVKAL